MYIEKPFFLWSEEEGYKLTNMNYKDIGNKYLNKFSYNIL